MQPSNTTRIEHFFLLGFPGLTVEYYAPVSILLLIIFLAIAVGNILIIVLVYIEHSLHKPTYLIFCHLALSDLAFGIVTLPKIIAKYWFGSSVIEFTACFIQMYFVHFLAATHSFILMMVALDRFLAICIPLRYSSFTNKVANILCGLSWLLAASWMVAIVIIAYNLSYCDSNVIVHCYCDHPSITALECNKQQMVQLMSLMGAMFFLLVPLTFIIFSLFAILFVVMRISSQEARMRTLSTCAPQLLITLLYYAPRCFVYLVNYIGFTFSLPVRILVIMLYSILPAAINPLIYCFKTKDIKECLSKRYKMTKMNAALG